MKAECIELLLILAILILSYSITFNNITKSPVLLQPSENKSISLEFNSGNSVAYGNKILIQASTTPSTDFLLLTVNGTGTIDPWLNVTPYPFTGNSIPCSISNGIDYCIGGYIGSIYIPKTEYAFVNSFGIAKWQSTTPYPSNSGYQGCNTYKNYIYCIGGNSNKVYFAQISNNGIGPWYPSYNSYPISTGYLSGSCPIYNGYIYCIGGGIPGINWNSVYYSKIYSNGELSKWNSTTPYPYNSSNMPCPVYDDYVYCIGGNINSSLYSNSIYYAKFNDNGGLSTWTAEQNNYPSNVYSNACDIFNGYIYCIGNGAATYYAKLYDNGSISTWNAGQNYSANIASIDGSCPSFLGYIYCTGGILGNTPSNDVYYSKIGANILKSNVGSISYTICLLKSGCLQPGTYNITVIDENKLPEESKSGFLVVTPGLTANVLTYIIDGKVETLTGSFNGGNSPYTYNYTVTNSVDNSLVANLLVQNTITSNSFRFTIHSIPVILNAKLTIVDNSKPNLTVVMTNTIILEPSLYATASVSNQIIDQGQLEIIKVTSQNGISPYSYNYIISNSLNGNIIASVVASNYSTTNNFGFILPKKNDALGPLNVKIIVNDDNEPPSVANVYTTITASNSLYSYIPTIASFNVTNSTKKIIINETLPTAGSPPYSWQWLYSYNNSFYNDVTLGMCNVPYGNGALGGSLEQCIISPSSFNLTGQYNFTVSVEDNATSPETSIANITLASSNNTNETNATNILSTKLVSSEPKLITIQYGSCILTTNITVPNSYSFGFYHTKYTIIDNYIARNYTSATINGQNYILNASNITLIKGYPAYVELMNVSYSPIEKTVTVMACPLTANITNGYKLGLLQGSSDSINLNNNIFNLSSGPISTKYANINVNNRLYVLSSNESNQSIAVLNKLGYVYYLDIISLSNPSFASLQLYYQKFNAYAYGTYLLDNSSVFEKSIAFKNNERIAIKANSNNTLVSLYSPINGTYNVSILLASAKYPTPFRHKNQILVMNITVPNNVSVNITSSYNCNIPPTSIIPYILFNYSWNPMLEFMVDPASCGISFETPRSSTIGIFSSFVNLTTSTVSTTTTPTTSIIIENQNKYSNLYYIVAVTAILIIGIVAFIMVKNKNKMRNESKIIYRSSKEPNKKYKKSKSSSKTK